MKIVRYLLIGIAVLASIALLIVSFTAPKEVSQDIKLDEPEEERKGVIPISPKEDTPDEVAQEV